MKQLGTNQGLLDPGCRQGFGNVVPKYRWAKNTALKKGRKMGDLFGQVIVAHSGILAGGGKSQTLHSFLLSAPREKLIFAVDFEPNGSLQFKVQGVARYC